MFKGLMTQNIAGVPISLTPQDVERVVRQAWEQHRDETIWKENEGAIGRAMSGGGAVTLPVSLMSVVTGRHPHHLPPALYTAYLHDFTVRHGIRIIWENCGGMVWEWVVDQADADDLLCIDHDAWLRWTYARTIEAVNPLSRPCEQGEPVPMREGENMAPGLFVARMTSMDAYQSTLFGLITQLNSSFFTRGLTDTRLTQLDEILQEMTYTEALDYYVGCITANMSPGVSR